METKDVLLQLRTQKGYSQDELAEQARAYFAENLPKLAYWKKIQA